MFTGCFGFSWLSELLTETVEEGRLCVDVEGSELQCEAQAVPLGRGKLVSCVEVGSGGCGASAPFWRGGG